MLDVLENEYKKKLMGHLAKNQNIGQYLGTIECQKHHVGRLSTTAGYLGT